jgi:hypothetical protein
MHSLMTQAMAHRIRMGTRPLTAASTLAAVGVATDTAKDTGATMMGATTMVAVIGQGVDGGTAAVVTGLAAVMGAATVAVIVKL